MSTLAYQEPYRISAGLLTLAVHACFLVLLYLGVNWQVRQPEGMEVELWGELPEASTPPAPIAPPAKAPPAKPVQAKPKPVEQAAPPAKADIELADKKKKKKKEAKKTVKPEPPKKRTKAEQKRDQDDLLAADKQTENLTAKEKAANNDRAALVSKAQAAIKNEIDKYTGLIGAKIRSKIVMPPDVPENVQAIFEVTLLPDGEVLDKKLVKSSGNAQYDDEVERAILKAQPLPLPTDEAAREHFINPKHLKLKFSPKDGE
jgi:colicin import membrane protein